jgi:hypothetical protein
MSWIPPTPKSEKYSRPSTALEKCLSRIAPAGKIEAIRLAHRRVAAAQGQLDNYSPSDKAKLLKGKKNI